MTAERAAADGLATDTSRESGERTALAIGGIAPMSVVAPATRDAVAAHLRDASASGAAVVPLGLGAHRGLGHAPARYDVALSTRALTRVVEYAPADMTVTVESGVTLADLETLLAREGQWLPLAPPLPARTTAGGLVGADLPGWLRASQGRVRDYVIGIGMTTADGRAVRAGGKVVKNVAGYDLMKLMIGSLGTLAVVTEITFKVRPRPATTRVLELACGGREEAFVLASRLADLGEAVLALVVLDTLPEPSALVRCVLAGVAADVTVARDRVGAALRGARARVVVDDDGEAPAARALVADARDLPRLAAGDLVVRATALRTRAPALVAELVREIPVAEGRVSYDPRAGSATLAIAVPDAAAALVGVRAIAARHDATIVVERWPDALATTIEVWSPQPSALPLMRRLKQALDPAGTLAPGRCVGRL